MYFLWTSGFWEEMVGCWRSVNDYRSSDPRDGSEIKKWLDWGRANVKYIMVRKDLPVWPAVGKVDGSAHVVGQRGFMFLFNPNKDSLPGAFALSEESIGLKGDGTFRVSQFYPTAERMAAARYGETVRWDIPGQTAVILDIRPTP